MYKTRVNAQMTNVKKKARNKKSITDFLTRISLYKTFLFFGGA